MPVSDVDDQAIELEGVPSSTNGRYLIRWIHGVVDDLTAKLDRRTRAIRRVLVEHDSRMDVLEDDGRNLLVEQNRADRVNVLPESGARGALLLEQGNDAYLFVGLGLTKPLGRVALELLPPIPEPVP